MGSFAKIRHKISAEEKKFLRFQKMCFHSSFVHKIYSIHEILIHLKLNFKRTWKAYKSSQFSTTLFQIYLLKRLKFIHMWSFTHQWHSPTPVEVRIAKETRHAGVIFIKHASF